MTYVTERSARSDLEFWSKQADGLRELKEALAEQRAAAPGGLLNEHQIEAANRKLDEIGYPNLDAGVSNTAFPTIFDQVNILLVLAEVSVKHSRIDLEYVLLQAAKDGVDAMLAQMREYDAEAADAKAKAGALICGIAAQRREIEERECRIEVLRFPASAQSKTAETS